MDFCVLGLLLIQEMTIYQLNKAFQTSLSLFYSASLGSLQKATAKLLKEGKISRREVYEGKRLKKIYRILPSGKAAFLAEIISDLPSSRLEENALARISFLGLLETAEQKETVLTLIINAVESSLNDLISMKTDLTAAQIPDSCSEIFSWQIKTLDYGVMAHQAGLVWFRTVFDDLHSSSQKS